MRSNTMDAMQFNWMDSKQWKGFNAMDVFCSLQCNGYDAIDAMQYNTMQCINAMQWMQCSGCSAIEVT